MCAKNVVKCQLFFQYLQKNAESVNYYYQIYDNLKLVCSREKTITYLMHSIKNKDKSFMITLKQKRFAETFQKPLYCKCPHCGQQLVFFYSSPILCNKCARTLKIRYLDLFKLVDYRVKYHFNQNI